MRPLLYILADDGEAVPVPCDDREVWGRRFACDRGVALTTIGELIVSTVFLAMDHGIGVGPPELFETMIFRGELGENPLAYQVRYATRAEALQGHELSVARARALDRH